MKMYFKQRLFSWLDSYDIFDENGNTIYTVESQLSWGHCLHILDASGHDIGVVKEQILTIMPRFAIYADGEQIGMIYRNFTFFHPSYTIDFNGWQVEGDIMTWNYTITDSQRSLIAEINKDLFNLTDCYCINTVYPEDALVVLMTVLAIDADKCSHSD